VWAVAAWALAPCIVADYVAVCRSCGGIVLCGTAGRRAGASGKVAQSLGLFNSAFALPAARSLARLAAGRASSTGGPGYQVSPLVRSAVTSGRRRTSGALPTWPPALIGPCHRRIAGPFRQDTRQPRGACVGRLAATSAWRCVVQPPSPGSTPRLLDDYDHAAHCADVRRGISVSRWPNGSSRHVRHCRHAHGFVRLGTFGAALLALTPSGEKKNNVICSRRAFIRRQPRRRDRQLAGSGSWPRLVTPRRPCEFHASGSYRDMNMLVRLSCPMRTHTGGGGGGGGRESPRNSWFEK